MGRRFSDPSYVDDARDGVFPRIHRHVLELAREFADEPEWALDIGAATGVLARGLLEVGRSGVICIEPNPQYILAAGPPSDRLGWICGGIQRCEQVDDLAKHLREPPPMWGAYGPTPTLVTARRSLYLIEQCQAGLVAYLAGKLADAGVKKFIVEGCVPVKNPRVKLFSTEQEVEAVLESGKWQIAHTRGPATLLVPKLHE